MRELGYFPIDDFDNTIYFVCFGCEKALMFTENGEWFKTTKNITKALLKQGRAFLTTCPECQEIALLASKVRLPRKDSDYG